MVGTVTLDGARRSLTQALAVRDGVPRSCSSPPPWRWLAPPWATTNNAGRERPFTVGRAALIREPDRYRRGVSSVGARVIVAVEAAEGAGLLSREAAGRSIRYRLAAHGAWVSPRGADRRRSRRRARPAQTDWESGAQPEETGDRLRRVIDRLATYLGLAAIVALAIGLTGAWAGARVWIGRRTRTIALYRLSGAEPALVVALHAAIVAIAGAAGIAIGLAGAAALAWAMM